MPDPMISDLAAKSSPASGDLISIVDVGAAGAVDPSFPGRGPAGTTRKATVAQLSASVSTALGLRTAATHDATDFAPAAVHRQGGPLSRPEA